MLSELVLRVRHAVYRTFAEGGVPRSAALAHALDIPIDEVRRAYHQLHDLHAIVLGSDSREIEMALPFSAVPTPHRVTSGDREWYANCAWDAFGIPALLNCDARCESRCADCDAPMVHSFERGNVVDAHGVVHFAVPASRWWDDIGFT